MANWEEFIQETRLNFRKSSKLCDILTCCVSPPQLNSSFDTNSPQVQWKSAAWQPQEEADGAETPSKPYSQVIVIIWSTWWFLGDPLTKLSLFKLTWSFTHCEKNPLPRGISRKQYSCLRWQIIFGSNSRLAKNLRRNIWGMRYLCCCC